MGWLQWSLGIVITDRFSGSRREGCSLKAVLSVLAWIMARLPFRRRWRVARPGMVRGIGRPVPAWLLLETVRRCLPDKTPAEARRIVSGMYRNLGANGAEILRLAGGRFEDMEARVTFEGEALIREALEKGRGVLVLAAHVGNWDLLAMFAAQRGYRLTLISKELKNRALNDMWMRLRKHSG